MSKAQRKPATRRTTTKRVVASGRKSRSAVTGRRSSNGAVRGRFVGPTVAEDARATVVRRAGSRVKTDARIDTVAPD